MSGVVQASHDSGKDVATNRVGVQQTAARLLAYRIGACYDTHSSMQLNIQTREIPLHPRSGIAKTLPNLRFQPTVLRCASRRLTRKPFGGLVHPKGTCYDPDNCD